MAATPSKVSRRNRIRLEAPTANRGRSLADPAHTPPQVKPVRQAARRPGPHGLSSRDLRTGHQLDLRALAVPVLAVAAAAVMFLHSVPGGGSDIALDLLCMSAGVAMGAIGGLATRLRLGADGRPVGRAGVLAAGMWIAGVGARMVFYFAATHGAGPAIARFSIAHHITSSAAWTAALVMMALADVLTRLVVVYLRGHRLTATGTPVIAASVQAGAGA